MCLLILKGKGEKFLNKDPILFEQILSKTDTYKLEIKSPYTLLK